MTDSQTNLTSGSHPLSDTQRWLSGILGVLASAGGTAAIFFKNNNAGAAVLLIIGLAFLLMAITARAITSVKIPGGGGVDLEARETAKQADAHADEAKGAAESAGMQANYAIAVGTTAARLDLTGTSFNEGIGTARRRTEFGIDQARSAKEVLPLSELVQLIDQYEQIRSEYKSGPARTRRMTEVVAEMGRVCLLLDDFDWGTALRSDRQGERLAGYVYLFNRPRPDGAIALVDALLRDDKPFGEYWALLALQKCLAIATPDTIAEVIPRLRRLEYPPGTDRSYELMQTLPLVEPGERTEP
jgi:hypothetical protein